MKILFMTGSHPRHAYLANCIKKTGALAGLIIEEREAHIPSPPEGLSPELNDLFIHHFNKRAEAEAHYFNDKIKQPDTETLLVSKDTLNGSNTHEFIKNIKPDILLSYGVHKLSDETINCAPKEKWNIHGGLSPWYRGVITHFWPSYFLEPQMTGMTVHDLTQDIDGGALVHQSIAKLVPNDGLHDLACRAVLSLGEEIPQLVEAIQDLENIKKMPHKTTGRIWRSKDWRPEHLKLIYQVYNDKIVDAYLNGELENSKPILHRQF